MRYKIIFNTIILIFAVSNLLIVLGQNNSDEQDRKLRPREYAQELPQKYASNRPKVAKTKPTNKKPTKYIIETANDSVIAQGTDVGFTFWRLRDSKKDDDVEVVEETRIAKKEKGKTIETSVKFTPERAQSNTEFSNGDRLRFTVESPIKGYIYLINREQYEDGSYSAPYLIFPDKTNVGRNDQVSAGKLVFIPSETENLILFNISEENSQKKIAEEFTVLISPQPLKDLPPLAVDEEFRKISLTEFEKWQKQWGGEVWKFEQESNIKTAISKVEKNASLTKKETLNQDDQLPQTVYHVAHKPTQPILFTVVVKIRA
ncbi:MAG: hypothetical protein WAQ98_32010 [Blastocatellia bacterium]